MKTPFGSLLRGALDFDSAWACRIALSMMCVALLGCHSGPHRGEVSPAAGLELQVRKSGSPGEGHEWLILASSAEIDRLVYASSRSGSTEIWVRFPGEHYMRLMKILHDDSTLRPFRVVVDGTVVCTFERDVLGLVGRPGVCIRLDSRKEARRILRAIGASQPI